MQLGFASAILPDLTLFQVLEFAAEVGYDCVEVSAGPRAKPSDVYAGVTHIDLTHDLESVVAECEACVERTGVRITALGYYPKPPLPQRGESRSCQPALYVA